MNRSKRPYPAWWIQKADLYDAIEKGDKERAKLLLSKGARVSRFWGEPLLRAVVNSDIEMVEILLTAGVHPDGDVLPLQSEVDEEEYDCRTALEYAAEGGMKEMVALLLSKGANVNARSSGGWTRLHGCYKMEMLQLFISHGGDVNAATDDGMTPLMFAAEEAPLEVAEYLVSKGANVNATDHLGQTPLMHAALDGDADMCEFLIAHGATVDATDNEGMTAADHYYSLPAGMAPDPGPEAFLMQIEDEMLLDEIDDEILLDEIDD